MRVRPNYNHSREDSPLYPCPTCSALQTWRERRRAKKAQEADARAKKEQEVKTSAAAGDVILYGIEGPPTAPGQPLKMRSLFLPQSLFANDEGNAVARHLRNKMDELVAYYADQGMNPRDVEELAHDALHMATAFWIIRARRTGRIPDDPSKEPGK